MADIQTVAALISSAKTALDISKTIIGIRDDTKLQAMQSELQIKLIEVLDFAVAAKSDQLDSIGRISALEKEIAELKEWNAQEQEYDLVEIPIGAFARVKKVAADSNAQEVWYCDTCFGNRQLRVLHLDGTAERGYHSTWRCHSCRTVIHTERGMKPGHWRHRVEQLQVGREINEVAEAKHLAVLKEKRDGALKG